MITFPSATWLRRRHLRASYHIPAIFLSHSQNHGCSSTVMGQLASTPNPDPPAATAITYFMRTYWTALDSSRIAEVFPLLKWFSQGIDTLASSSKNLTIIGLALAGAIDPSSTLRSIVMQTDPCAVFHVKKVERGQPIRRRRLAVVPKYRWLLNNPCTTRVPGKRRPAFGWTNLSGHHVQWPAMQRRTHNWLLDFKRLVLYWPTYYGTGFDSICDASSRLLPHLAFSAYIRSKRPAKEWFGGMSPETNWRSRIHTPRYDSGLDPEKTLGIELHITWPWLSIRMEYHDLCISLLMILRGNMCVTVCYTSTANFLIRRFDEETTGYWACSRDLNHITEATLRT